MQIFLQLISKKIIEARYRGEQGIVDAARRLYCLNITKFLRIPNKTIKKHPRFLVSVRIGACLSILLCLTEIVLATLCNFAHCVNFLGEQA